MGIIIRPGVTIGGGVSITAAGGGGSPPTGVYGSAEGLGTFFYTSFSGGLDVSYTTGTAAETALAALKTGSTLILLAGNGFNNVGVTVNAPGTGGGGLYSFTVTFNNTSGFNFSENGSSINILSF